MRTLLILRGAPGAGKSTWIKNHNLEAYTICPDTLRIMCSSTELKADGGYAITRNQETEQATWKILFELLEFRMSRGEFTVIDATASKTKDIKQYKDLADQYRYRMFVVDFTDVPVETCLIQNKMRPEYKWVPEDSIRSIYARFTTQQVPSGVKIIKPNELEQILEQPIDLSQYKKIVFIGDIHGCYDTLMQYFKAGIDPEIAYIFCGDYIDRGNQNAETVMFLSSIMDKPNVCLLEGNHERWLRDFGNEVPVKSRVFEKQTKPQLEAAKFTPKMARMLYKKMRQMSHFTYNGVEILACHGGIPNLSNNLIYLPTTSFIKGIGEYSDYLTIAETWMSSTKDNQYLIHGHRNTDSSETRLADRVFNLEGKVEYGGQIRIVELDSDLNWTTIELEDCQPVTKELNTEQRAVETVEDAITYLRNNKFVNEKQLGDNISSFNFSREAFLKGNWNNQTILARGLFVDTTNNNIIARSYEKFFRINELRSTELSSLKERLQFPVKAYVKENGFLAIVSYNYKTDDLFIASKSTNKGDYVDYIKAQLAPYYDKILGQLKYFYYSNQPLSLVFECVDIENDPHIIKYNNSKLVLLDAIYNTLEFKTVPYETLVRFANTEIGCPVKELAYELKNWDEFRNLYVETQDENYKYNGEYIEGFVFEDSTGFMTKCKTEYYNFWKHMRSVADQTLRCGYLIRTGSLQTETANYFYGFCRDLYKNYYDRETKSYHFKTDIISLREKFQN